MVMAQLTENELEVGKAQKARNSFKLSSLSRQMLSNAADFTPSPSVPATAPCVARVWRLEGLAVPAPGPGPCPHGQLHSPNLQFPSSCSQRGRFPSAISGNQLPITRSSRANCP